MSEASPIAVIEKNSREDVRISLSEFHGHRLVDVRTFMEFDGAPGDRRATKKGISLKVERLPDLIAALQKALEEARNA